MKLLAMSFLFALGVVNASVSTFKADWIHWESPELQLVFADSSHFSLDPAEFCRSMVSIDPSLSRPTCRVAGEWNRDSSSRVYLQWFSQNLDKRIGPRNLLSRDSSTTNRLKKLGDSYFILLTQRKDTLWTALFTGMESFEKNHDPIEPAALSWHYPAPQNEKDLAAALTASWFSGGLETRLTPEQRKEIAQSPDNSYSQAPAFDGWVAIGTGWSQASIPLLPSSWFNDKLRDRVEGYRYVRDSLSAWSLLEDESQIMSLRAGFTWSGFIGLELFGIRSTHAMKFNPTDSAYEGLDYWRFNRYEIGATAHVAHHRSLPAKLEWQVLAFLGFHYSFLSEEIKLLPGALKTDNYNHRIEFMPFYKGAIFGVSNKLVWNRLIGLEARFGLNNRGRSLDKEPNADATFEPTIIGGSTLDCFVSGALEYHLF